jgi:hypothetical protein
MSNDKMVAETHAAAVKNIADTAHIQQLLHRTLKYWWKSGQRRVEGWYFCMKEGRTSPSSKPTTAAQQIGMFRTHSC